MVKLTLFSFGIIMLALSAYASACEYNTTCPFEADSDTIVVQFDTDWKLYANSDSHRYSPIESVNIPAGVYDVTLVSRDGYDGRQYEYQKREQWQVLFFKDGDIITGSEMISDLPDGIKVAEVIEQVNDGLIIPHDIDSVKASHSFYYEDNHQSVAPICMKLDLVEENRFCEREDAINFDYNLIRSDMEFSDAYHRPSGVDISAGTYFITLISHDGYHQRRYTSQDFEQWYVWFYLLDISTESTFDLQDDIDYITTVETFDEPIEITEDTLYLKAVHDAYYDGSSSNNVKPVCMLLDPLTHPECGDGDLNPPDEECDYGSNNGISCIPPYEGSCTYCTNDCELIEKIGPYCGDGKYLIEEEECDYGLLNGLVCNPLYESTCLYCTTECEEIKLTGPYCGDDVIQETYETCDDGIINGIPCIPSYDSSCTYCSIDCEPVEIPGNKCGDGILDEDTETCDYGPDNGISCEPEYGNSCTYCDLQCLPVEVPGPYCGDGVMQPLHEECDELDGVPESLYCTEECTLSDLQMTFDIYLDKKWNLISIPLELYNDSVVSVFNNTPEIIAVWSYNSSSGRWKIYREGVHSNLERIVPGIGYWVLAENDTVLTITGNGYIRPEISTDIVHGWNLIGYFGTDGLTSYNGHVGAGKEAGCVLSFLEIEGSKGFSSLIAYDETFNPDLWIYLESTDRMDPGEGYWLFADMNGSYGPLSSC